MNQKKMKGAIFFSLAKGTWTEKYQNLVTLLLELTSDAINKK